MSPTTVNAPSTKNHHFCAHYSPLGSLLSKSVDKLSTHACHPVLDSYHGNSILILSTPAELIYTHGWYMLLHRLAQSGVDTTVNSFENFLGLKCVACSMVTFYLLSLTTFDFLFSVKIDSTSALVARSAPIGSITYEIPTDTAAFCDQATVFRVYYDHLVDMTIII